MRLDTSFVKVEKCFLRCYFLTAGSFLPDSQGLSSRISAGEAGEVTQTVLFKAGCNGSKVAHKAGRSTLADC